MSRMGQGLYRLFILLAIGVLLSSVLLVTFLTFSHMVVEGNIPNSGGVLDFSWVRIGVVGSTLVGFFLGIPLWIQIIPEDKEKDAHRG